MNKDKEWLIKRVENYIPLNDKTVGHVVDNILDIICQLDEPKVLSQEWIDNNVIHVRGLGDVLKAEDVESMLVPNQGLPVIPQWVADNIESKKRVGTRLNVAMSEFPEFKLEKELGIDEHECNELYARAWLDGYEIEKEKLYYVLDKQGKTLLVLMGGEVRISGGYVLNDSTATKDIYQLTEKQIKDYDERFLKFAVEVQE